MVRIANLTTFDTALCGIEALISKDELLKDGLMQVYSSLRESDEPISSQVDKLDKLLNLDKRVKAKLIKDLNKALARPSKIDLSDSKDNRGVLFDNNDLRKYANGTKNALKQILREDKGESWIREMINLCEKQCKSLVKKFRALQGLTNKLTLSS